MSQYGVIASDRRERGDLNSATAAVTRDCHVAALLAMTVFRVCMVSIHNYDTACLFGEDGSSAKPPPNEQAVSQLILVECKTFGRYVEIQGREEVRSVVNGISIW